MKNEIFCVPSFQFDVQFAVDLYHRTTSLNLLEVSSVPEEFNC